MRKHGCHLGPRGRRWLSGPRGRSLRSRPSSLKRFDPGLGCPGLGAVMGKRKRRGSPPQQGQAASKTCFSTGMGQTWSSILCQIGFMTSTAIAQSEQSQISFSTGCLLLLVMPKKTMSSGCGYSTWFSRQKKCAQILFVTKKVHK